ncbi:MAG: hypothetical protein KF803_08830 [Cyclobacteriaceae bacterium]|nr:hypothetical protein [Cyclobacteriaceae bacterium]
MKRILIFFSITLLCATCSELDKFEGVPIRQYAHEVIDFSSQYSSTSWAATKALGEENVYPNHEDNTNAWASYTTDGQREFIVLGFETPQTVHTIEIYETYNPGAIDTVFIRNESTGEWRKVYSKPARTDLPLESRIFAIYFQETTFLADAIRLALNSPAVPGWNEIDAVAIGGQRKK